MSPTRACARRSRPRPTARRRASPTATIRCSCTSGSAATAPRPTRPAISSPGSTASSRGMVGYHKARPNFAMLNEIPLRLREHAERQEANAEAARRELAALENAAIDAAGGKPIARGARGGASRGSPRSTRQWSPPRTSATRRSRSSASWRRAATRNSRAAIAGLGEALGREDLKALLDEARLTRTGAGRHDRPADRRRPPARGRGRERDQGPEAAAQDAGRPPARARGHPVRVQEVSATTIRARASARTISWATCSPISSAAGSRAANYWDHWRRARTGRAAISPDPGVPRGVTTTTTSRRSTSARCSAARSGATAASSGPTPASAAAPAVEARAAVLAAAGAGSPAPGRAARGGFSRRAAVGFSTGGGIKAGGGSRPAAGSRPQPELPAQSGSSFSGIVASAASSVEFLISGSSFPPLPGSARSTENRVFAASISSVAAEQRRERHRERGRPRGDHLSRRAGGSGSLSCRPRRSRRVVGPVGLGRRQRAGDFVEVGAREHGGEGAIAEGEDHLRAVGHGLQGHAAHRRRSACCRRRRWRSRSRTPSRPSTG